MLAKNLQIDSQVNNINSVVFNYNGKLLEFFDLSNNLAFFKPDKPNDNISLFIILPIPIDLILSFSSSFFKLYFLNSAMLVIDVFPG